MRLAFSLPVHENNDVVLNLLSNIFRCNPGCIVVLHVSQLFTDFDHERFCRMPNVYINARRHLTGYGTGLMLVHCSNFCHLEWSRASFDAFCIISSNEMFIRSGLNDYVAQAKNGFQAVLFDLQRDWHLFYHRVDQRPEIGSLLAQLGTNAVYGGQTEGQFFQKSVFERIVQHYFGVFGEVEIHAFETEEVVPQTIAMAMKLQPSLPFTLVDYTHPLTFKLSPEVVATLADESLEGRVKLNLGPKGRKKLVSPHLDVDSRSVFSVKRVPRQMNDPLRVFINQLMESRLSDCSPEGPRRHRTVQEGLVPLLPETESKKDEL